MVDDTTILIHLKEITFAYPGAPPVLDKLGLTFSRGQRIGLLGPNGSGKTTLFHVIMGLLKPTSGTIKILGKPMIKEADFIPARKRIGLVFQDADDQLFSPTVLEDVAFGPLNQGKTREEAIDISKQTLALLGLEGYENKITHKLSGGEKKLVSLATTLSMKPEALLLDEPANGLDEKTKERLSSVLSDLDISLILISHNMDFMTQLTNSIYVIDSGKISTEGIPKPHQHLHIHPFGNHSHEHKQDVGGHGQDREDKK